jgi:hypothetical protein
VALARFNPSGERCNEVRYIVELRPGDSEESPMNGEIAGRSVTPLSRAPYASRFRPARSACGTEQPRNGR